MPSVVSGKSWPPSAPPPRANSCGLSRTLADSRGHRPACFALFRPERHLLDWLAARLRCGCAKKRSAARTGSHHLSCVSGQVRASLLLCPPSLLHPFFALLLLFFCPSFALLLALTSGHAGSSTCSEQGRAPLSKQGDVHARNRSAYPLHRL